MRGLKIAGPRPRLLQFKLKSPSCRSKIIRNYEIDLSLSYIICYLNFRMKNKYDALFLVSFGGPEGKADVMPFLDNVLRGKNVPDHRKMQVAEHYYQFEGVSPINAQNRMLIDALKTELQRHEISLPIYWGNRNWKPFIKDTLVQMRDDGVESVLLMLTSGFSCYSGCRQYREHIAEVMDELDYHPHMQKLRMWFNHPQFLACHEDRIKSALNNTSSEVDAEDLYVLFTAHSIPLTMAEQSAYTMQLQNSAGLLAERLGLKNWSLAYQSRSGPPTVPWLEPDVNDLVKTLDKKFTQVLAVPLGFVSDHMEVIYDLDHELHATLNKLEKRYARAQTPGTHPQFLACLLELIKEHVDDHTARYEGNLGLFPQQCGDQCCLRS